MFLGSGHELGLYTDTTAAENSAEYRLSREELDLTGEVQRRQEAQGEERHAEWLLQTERQEG